MITKKEAAIVVLLAILVVVGICWLSPMRKSTQNNQDNTTPPSDNMEIFPGYENYLDNITYTLVSGTSMEPTFGDGDAVIWVGVENVKNLVIGEIIIYNHPTKPDEGMIAHRIIDITKNGTYRFETKGDNRTESDAHTEISAYYVSENNIIGLVIGVWHNVPSG